MPRTKSSLLKVANFDPLLQDIRNSLGENYVFYKECIVAISRATACGQDASAWFEQFERLVEGVDEVAFSHAGVQFLLREMARGEGEISDLRHPHKQTTLPNYIKLRSSKRCHLPRFLTASNLLHHQP
jgi:hypothetical protein